MKEEKGLTKENTKKLFSFKGTWQDWLVFIMLVMVLLTAIAYKKDIESCSQAIQDIKDRCAIWKGELNSTGLNDGNEWNNFIINPNGTT